MTITLVLGESGTIGGESYVLTIPDSLTITNDTWNPFNPGINAAAESGKTFSGTLTVTAASSHDWYLVLSTDATDKDSVGYTLAISKDATENTTTWTFTADEVNADGGTTKPAGVILGDHSGKTAGTYVDTITFTASTATTKTITWDSTFVSSINISNGESVSQDGITFTIDASGFSETYFRTATSPTYTSTVGNIAKIEIYTQGDAPEDDSVVAYGWGDDWSYDSTTHVFTWSGTPSATVTTGVSAQTTSNVTSFVFTVE